MTEKVYVIVNTPVTQSQVDAAIQTSLSTVRESADGTQAVLKYKGAQPAIFDGLTEYTNAEIRVEMAKEEWVKGD